MLKKTIIAALVSLTCLGAAQAQTCPCASSGTLLTAAALQTTLAGKMVCASVGSEQWQELHDGSSSGRVVDYKAGPSDAVDPSGPVGTYAINRDGTINYTYGASTYRYAVCQTGATYAFCGAAYGGRDIAAARVSASAGLQACSGVQPTTGASRANR